MNKRQNIDNNEENVVKYSKKEFEEKVIIYVAAFTNLFILGWFIFSSFADDGRNYFFWWGWFLIPLVFSTTISSYLKSVIPSAIGSILYLIVYIRFLFEAEDKKAIIITIILSGLIFIVDLYLIYKEDN